MLLFMMITVDEPWHKLLLNQTCHFSPTAWKVSQKLLTGEKPWTVPTVIISSKWNLTFWYISLYNQLLLLLLLLLAPMSVCSMKLALLNLRSDRETELQLHGTRCVFRGHTCLLLSRLVFMTNKLINITMTEVTSLMRQHSVQKLNYFTWHVC